MAIAPIASPGPTALTHCQKYNFALQEGSGQQMIHIMPSLTPAEQGEGSEMLKLTCYFSDLILN